MLRWTLLCVLTLGLACPTQAQESNADCQAGSLNLSDSDGQASSTTQTKQTAVTDATPAVSATPSTEAETQVQNIIADDGLHVVHFWAPWCSNSKAELNNGWASLVRDNPNVTFTFVTVWNDGTADTATLDEYNLPGRVTTVAQPDLGPSDNESNRRRSFLTHPMTWIPSTWIFHNNGELAFAMNYGEMEMSTIQSLIDATRTDW
jgi:thiol-disulfide isomerase/thioredoxin